MNKRWLSFIVSGLVSILVTFLAGCASTPANQQPIEVVSVSGPLQPINPGGPLVEITLKNISDEPVVSLNAILEVNITIETSKSFTFDFNVTSSNPLLPNKSINSKLILIGGGFGDDISYPLTIKGTLQSGTTFVYTKQVWIVTP